MAPHGAMAAADACPCGATTALFALAFANHAAQRLRFHLHPVERDLATAVHAQAVVFFMHPRQRAAHGRQVLDVDFRQRHVHLAVHGALRRVVEVLRQQVAGVFDPRAPLLVHFQLPAQLPLPRLQFGLQQGPLSNGEMGGHGACLLVEHDAPRHPRQN